MVTAKTFSITSLTNNSYRLRVIPREVDTKMIRANAFVFSDNIHQL